MENIKVDQVFLVMALLVVLVVTVFTWYSLNKLKKQVMTEVNEEKKSMDYMIVKSAIIHNRKNANHNEALLNMLENFKQKYGNCQEYTELNNKLWQIDAE